MANPESEQDHDTVPPILPLESNLPTSSGSDNASQDEEDDGQALLLRHTKVTVTGNNRTKQSLVGLTGVVKKAVGLGGWHWLVSLSGHYCCRCQLLCAEKVQCWLCLKHNIAFIRNFAMHRARRLGFRRRLAIPLLLHRPLQYHAGRPSRAFV